MFLPPIHADIVVSVRGDFHGCQMSMVCYSNYTSVLHKLDYSGVGGKFVEYHPRPIWVRQRISCMAANLYVHCLCRQEGRSGWMNTVF